MPGESFSKILNFRLVNWLSDKNILSEEQLGFVKENRTSDAHIMLYNLIQKYCRKGNKRLYACFVDFEKAFDSISREKLLKKMRSMGITGKFLNIIAAMYKDDLVQVKLGNKVTESICVTTGVRQGCVLSPTLFNLFLADFIAILKNKEATDPACISTSEEMCTLLWADDVLLVSESAQGLQNQINCLVDYAKLNDLTINIDKTKSVCFNKSGHLIRNSFTISKDPIEDVRSFKYLGFVFTCGGSLKPGLADLKDRGQKAFYALKKHLGYSFMRYPDVSIKLYNAIVKQILLYASDFWGVYDIRNSPIESLHTQFCKHILGISKRACVNAALLEVGFYPLHIDAKMRVLRNWLRISQGYCNSLMKKFFSSEDSVDGSWKFEVESLLKKYGFGFIFNAEDDTKISFIQKKIETFLKKLFIEGAISNMTTPTSKMLLFAGMVDGSKPLYISKVSCVKNRVLLSKMRMSDHDLEVQKGRYNNTPRNERVCMHCNTQVENEEHFMLHCKLYEEFIADRDASILSIYPHYNSLNDWEKVKFLLNGNSEDVIPLTCTFLEKAMEIRKDFLELIEILEFGIG